jgi:hypothetical protein
VAGGEFLAEDDAAAVRVELALGQGALGSLDGLGRRPEGVFVGSQFIDARGIEAELARHIFDGLARLVHRLRQDGGVDQRLEFHRAHE